MTPEGAATSPVRESPDAGIAEGGVARVVRILESVAGAPDGVGVRALARETGIDKSAVSRLLRQLAAVAFVEADASHRYVVGPQLYAMAKLVVARDDLTRAARPFLSGLAAEWNETCYLAVLEGREVVYRDMIECNQPLRYVVPLGEGVPLHAGAGGRAILSALPTDRVAALLSPGRLSRLTPSTVTDRVRLRDIIREDRARGYTMSVGERVVVGAAVAAPFLDAQGDCRGALVVAFPRERVQSHDIEALGRAVAAAATGLSRRLGYLGESARRSI